MLLSNLDVLATARGGVARLRELILTLAVQGKLVPQDPADEPASELLKKIRVEKERLIAAGKTKRDKPLLPIAEDEKPFELPQGWEWVRLADVVRVLNGRAYGKQELLETGPVPVLRVGNLFTSKHWYYSDLVLEPEKYCDAGDLLYAWSASFGPFIWEGPKSIYHYHIWKLEPWASRYFDTGYFHKYLDEKTAEIKAAGHGVSMLHMTKDKMEKIVVPYPPLAEQSRIVTRVEELMRLCDALEAKGQLEATQHSQLVSSLLGQLTASSTPDELHANWQRVAQHFDLLLDRPAAVDALEQTILQLAVRGLLVAQDPTDEPASTLLQKIRLEKDRLIAEGKIKRDKPLAPIAEDEWPFELPMGWECVRFGDYFFELCTGPFGSVIHKEDYVDAGVPLINPSHMIGGRISHDPSVSVSSTMAERLGAYRLTAGDVVLARRGEVGRYALVTRDEDGWLCGTGSFFVKLHETCDREFLGLVLEDPELRSHLLGESVGSTMTNLNQRILMETLIALPPLAEQSRIVARVESLRRLCADLRQRLAARQSTQAQLAEALVNEAG